MSRLKYSKKRTKKTPFIAVIPKDDMLVEIYNTPKSLFNIFKKNSNDLDKNYRMNNN